MKPSEVTFWVTIESESGNCFVEFFKEGEFAIHYSGGRLDLDRQFVANKQTLTLRSLRERLVNYDLLANNPIFEERGQLDIGRELFVSIFGPDGEKTRLGLLNQTVNVRIVSDNEDVALLPWSLLWSGNLFLAQNRWSIAVSAPKDKCSDALLPPSPKILVVTPCPLDLDPTEAAEHLRDLEARLSLTNSLYQRDKNFQCVESWPDFIDKVENYQPDILYFYGHGEGNTESSQLIFANPDGTSFKVAAADFARVLRRQQAKSLVVAYVNCCHGDAGGVLGVGKQLADFIPAVITNCTKAYISAAREQAMNIWEKILVDGLSPHQAVVSTRAYSDKLGLFSNDLRWMTPVLHYSYRDWSFTPPPVVSNPAARDLKWGLRLNRLNQFSKVMEQVEPMLDRNENQALAFVIYGTPEQGIKDFYERIDIELPEKLKFELIDTIELSWPMEFVDNYHRSFSEKICRAFGTYNLEDVKAKVEASVRQRRSAKPNVIFISHTAIELPTDLSMITKHVKRLGLYLNWMDSFLVSALPANVTPIIALSFVIPESFDFKSPVEELSKQLKLVRLKFVVLDELKPIERSDLEWFVRVNRISFPIFSEKDPIADILENTGGAYEKVLRAVMHFADYWSADRLEATVLKYD